MSYAPNVEHAWKSAAMEYTNRDRKDLWWFIQKAVFRDVTAVEVFAHPVQ